MRKAKIVKICFLLISGIIVVLGFMVVKASDNDMMKQSNMIPSEEGMMGSMYGCTMKNMHGCIMDCTINYENIIKDTSEAIALLDRAVKALEAGNTNDTKVDIENTQKILKCIQIFQSKCMRKLPTFNAHCPISGKQFDMMNIPGNLTTMYKGKKVGFCCQACLSVWDKMSDTEKDKKIKEVTPIIPEKEGMMEDMVESVKMQKK